MTEMQIGFVLAFCYMFFVPIIVFALIFVLVAIISTRTGNRS